MMIHLDNKNENDNKDGDNNYKNSNGNKSNNHEGNSKTLLQNSQGDACIFSKKETLAQVFSCEFFNISKNTFSYRTHPVAASGRYSILNSVCKCVLISDFSLLFAC